MRVVTKIGDIFSVEISETEKKYFQLVAFDLTQLNSDVIRAFKETYPINEKDDVSKIIEGDVQFYAHCVTNISVKMGFWKKVGKVKEVGQTNNILFRGSSDYGRYPRRKIISEDWYVWKINENTTKVGKLIDEYQKAEIGLVFSPDSIVYRMRTGEYDYMEFYPGYG